MAGKEYLWNYYKKYQKLDLFKKIKLQKVKQIRDH